MNYYCPKCEGDITCAHCDGTGTVREHRLENFGMGTNEPCPACHGSGKNRNHRCPSRGKSPNGKHIHIHLH